MSAKTTNRITLKFRGDLGPYYRTVEIDDDGFVKDIYFSDEHGERAKSQPSGTSIMDLKLAMPRIAFPPAKMTPEQEKAVAEARRRRRESEMAIHRKSYAARTTLAIPDHEFREEFLSDRPCWFEGCEELRKELHDRIEAAGGDDCPNCKRGAIEGDVLTRAWAMQESGKTHGPEHLPEDPGGPGRPDGDDPHGHVGLAPVGAVPETGGGPEEKGADPERQALPDR